MAQKIRGIIPLLLFTGCTLIDNTSDSSPPETDNSPAAPIVAEEMVTLSQPPYTHARNSPLEEVFRVSMSQGKLPQPAPSIQQHPTSTPTPPPLIYPTPVLTPTPTPPLPPTPTPTPNHLPTEDQEGSQHPNTGNQEDSESHTPHANNNENNDERPQEIFFRDNDGDQWGGNEFMRGSGDPPEGYSQRHGDCNDNDASVHPGVLDICDSINNNCDELVDEDDILCQKIAVALKDGGVYVVNKDGSFFTQITSEKASQPLWDSTNQQLALLISRTRITDYQVNSIFKADGSDENSITWGENQRSAHALSPEGNQLAYLEHAQDLTLLVTKPTTYGPARDIIALEGNIHGLHWLSESEIMYGRDNVVHATTLEGEERTLAEQVETFSLSPDKSLLAYVTLDEVKIKAVQEGSEETIAIAIPEYLALSPDNSKLAFIHTGNVYVLNRQSGEQEQLTQEGTCKELQWFNDGISIAYTQENKVNEQNSRQVYVHELNGVKKQVTDLPGEFFDIHVTQ
jgi:hypothetical protein